ncbi:hypothetical protein D3C85_1533090 [compost metagenome]
MCFQARCCLVADRTGGRKNTARACAVLEERRAIALHLERLAGGLRRGIQRRHPDQGMEQTVHPVVDDIGRRYGYAVAYAVQIVIAELVVDRTVFSYQG